MRVSVGLRDLRSALTLASKIVPPRGTVPVLHHVKIVSNDDRITITGTDLDVTVAVTLAAGVMTEGSALIPHATLASFCAAARGEELTIAVEGSRATVNAGRDRIALSTLPVEDFPTKDAADGQLVPLDAGTFCRALRFCTAAASKDDTRFHLAGPFIEEQAGQPVTMWGHNGPALHRAFLAGLPSVGGGAILPARAVGIILGIIEKATSPRFMACESGWHVQAGDVRAWGGVIDAKFPDVSRLWAQMRDWRELAVADGEAVSSALTMATCGADTMEKRIRAVVVRTAEGQPLVLRGMHRASGVLHAGRAEVGVEARGDAGVAVSSDLLGAALSGMVGADVSLAMIDQPPALMVRPAQGSAVIDLAAVLMTIRATEAELADA